MAPRVVPLGEVAREKDGQTDRSALSRKDYYMTSVYNHIRRAETQLEDVTTDVPDWCSRGMPQRTEASIRSEVTSMSSSERLVEVEVKNH